MTAGLFISSADVQHEPPIARAYTTNISLSELEICEEGLFSPPPAPPPAPPAPAPPPTAPPTAPPAPAPAPAPPPTAPPTAPPAAPAGPPAAHHFTALI